MKSYFDIQGDGGSNVVAQVEAQREAIQSALADVRFRIAVGSGKGGVGKSTVTMALAQALRASGATVAILDADFNGPCQAHLSGLTAAPWVPGVRGLSIPRRADGIGVVSMGSLVPADRPVALETVSHGDEHVWRSTKEFAVLGQLMGSLDWGSLDYLLFDLPPGAERSVQFADFLPPDTLFALVTLPSDVARGVVARSVAALETAGADMIGYVENMAGYYCQDCSEIKPLFPSAKTPIPLPLLGRIPFDPALAELCDRGWPEDEIQDRPSAQAIAAVALNLVRALEGRQS